MLAGTQATELLEQTAALVLEQPFLVKTSISCRVNELDKLSKYLGNSAGSAKQYTFPSVTSPREAPSSLRHSKVWALNTSYSQPIFNSALAGVCAFRKIMKLVSRWISTARDWNLDCIFFPANLLHNCQILLIIWTKFYWDNYCAQKIKSHRPVEAFCYISVFYCDHAIRILLCGDCWCVKKQKLLMSLLLWLNSQMVHGAFALLTWFHSPWLRGFYCTMQWTFGPAVWLRTERSGRTVCKPEKMCWSYPVYASLNIPGLTRKNGGKVSSNKD